MHGRTGAACSAYLCACCLRGLGGENGLAECRDDRWTTGAAAPRTRRTALFCCLPRQALAQSRRSASKVPRNASSRRRSASASAAHTQVHDVDALSPGGFDAARSPLAGLGGLGWRRVLRPAARRDASATTGRSSARKRRRRRRRRPTPRRATRRARRRGVLGRTVHRHVAAVAVLVAVAVEVVYACGRRGRRGRCRRVEGGVEEEAAAKAAEAWWRQSFGRPGTDRSTWSTRSTSVKVADQCQTLAGPAAPQWNAPTRSQSSSSITSRRRQLLIRHDCQDFQEFRCVLITAESDFNFSSFCQRLVGEPVPRRR